MKVIKRESVYTLEANEGELLVLEILLARLRANTHIVEDIIGGNYYLGIEVRSALSSIHSGVIEALGGKENDEEATDEH